MVSLLDLENLENWQTRLAEFLVTSKLPLPEYAPTFNFTSSVIAVFVDNSEALPTWHSAGWLNQKIILPVGPNGTANVKSQHLLLKQKQILLLENHFTASYQISITFRKWFTQASVTVWEYTGPQLNTVENQLQQAQAKLDLLLQQHLP